MVWEVRSTASGNAVANGGGGGFKPGATGVDYSQQNDCQYHITGATSAGVGAVILTASAAADMVGNIAHVISGTNFTVGWYEIISVSVGVSITVDQNVTSGVGAVGVVNVGGCISLNSSTANQTDTNWAAAIIAGNTIYVKGTPIVAATCTFANGTAAAPIQMLGYQTVRGDNPTGANRPSITCAAFTLNTGSANICKNIIFTGTNTNVVTMGSGSMITNAKVTNTSTTAGRTALNGATNGLIMNCETISYRGSAITLATGGHVFGCYVHDSNIGISVTGSVACTITDNIVESCVAQAINNSGAGTTNLSQITSNTLYGGENKTGVGLAIVSGTTLFRIYNNIIYGFTTGISDANGVGVNFGDYNCLNNNTANYSTFTAGANDITTTPGLTGVAQVTGTAGTVSSSTVTDATASFANVVDNRDFFYLVSGTGATAGQYLITSHTATSVTLDSVPGGSGTNIVYQVTTGRNFKAGANVKQIAFPQAFQAGLTTSYVDIGGAQRNGNIDQPATTDVKLGVVFNAGASTGSLLSGGGGSTNLGNPTIT